MRPLGITQYRLAKETNVPPRRINEIVQAKRSITADTALRLAKFFGTSEMFWLNLQSRYDLDVQREKLGACLTLVRPLVRDRETAGRPSSIAKRTVASARTPAAGSGKKRKAR